MVWNKAHPCLPPTTMTKWWIRQCNNMMASPTAKLLKVIHHAGSNESSGSCTWVAGQTSLCGAFHRLGKPYWHGIVLLIMITMLMIASRGVIIIMIVVSLGGQCAAAVILVLLGCIFCIVRIYYTSKNRPSSNLKQALNSSYTICNFPMR